MSEIRIGVIGCGHWGPNHVRVFSQLPGARAVACADLDAKRRAAVTTAFPAVEAFADHRELLARSPVDAVVVAAPTRLHFEVVRDALEAGKHVLCEKPLCLTADEAARLIDLAAQKKLTLMVGHVFLFNSGIVELKRRLTGGEAGRVHYLRATRTNLGPIRADVNSVYDLATHDIAIFNWLLDALPESASAVGGCFLRPGVEDVAFITLRYPQNVIAHVQVSWLDPKKVREIVAVGERKMLVWDELAVQGPIYIYDKGVDRQYSYEDFGQYQLLLREGDLTVPKLKLDEPLKVQNRFFLKCIETGTVPMNDGAFALGVVQVLEAITRSIQQNGASVAVSH